jgi:hypothetical protein
MIHASVNLPPHGCLTAVSCLEPQSRSNSTWFGPKWVRWLEILTTKRR